MFCGGGEIRLVTPDLENICKKYLEILEQVKETEQKFEGKYEFITIELLDQLTRNCRGGLLGEYLNREDIDKDFVQERLGLVFENSHMSLMEKIKKQPVKALKRGTEMVLCKIFGWTDFYKKWAIGNFHFSGEVHKWVYDSYSLEKLLIEAGFSKVVITQCNISKIENFEKYNLENHHIGQSKISNSLYIECIKKQEN